MTSAPQITRARPAPASGANTVARPAAGFALLATTQLLLILAISIVIVPVTMLAESTGYSRADIALVASGYGLVFAGLLLFGSRLGDKFGRRASLVTGLAIFAAASLIGALGTGYLMMVVARLLQGGGAALAAPAAMAMVGTLHTDPVRRNKALAVYGIMGSIGGVGGILTSGAIATWLSWRWSFAIPAIAATILAVAASRVLPAGKSGRQASLDAPGAVLATAGLLGVGYGLMRAGESSFTTPDSYLPLAGGVVLLLVFGVVETKVADPLLPLRFLLSKTRAVAWTALLLITAANAVATFVLTLYFQQVRGYSPAQIAAAFLPFTLVLATSLVSGRMITRFGPGWVAAIGLGVSAAGLGLIAQLTADGADWALLVTGMLILPLGVGLTFSGTTVTALADVPEHQAGLAGGLVNTSIEIGAAGGIAVLTAIIGGYTAALTADGVGGAAAATSAYGFGFTLLAIALTACAVACAVLLRPTRTKRHA